MVSLVEHLASSLLSRNSSKVHRILSSFSIRISSSCLTLRSFFFWFRIYRGRYFLVLRGAAESSVPVDSDSNEDVVDLESKLSKTSLISIRAVGAPLVLSRAGLGSV